MPFKNRDQLLVYRREWYSRNKKSELAHVKRRKLKIKKWFKDYKEKLSCLKCSEDHPATLDFHHKSKKDKDGGVGVMVNDGFSVRKILEEMGKCEVLCANCHRKLHYINDKV